MNDLIKICLINFMIKVATIILIDKMLNKFHELSMHLLTISNMIKTQLTVSLHIHMHSLTIFIPILS